MIPSQRQVAGQSLSRRAIGLATTTHPFPIGVVLATSLLLLMVVHRGSPGPVFLVRALLVVLLTQIPVGALNDYLDCAQDAAAGRTKPLVTGAISPRSALALTIVSLGALVPAALSFGPVPALVALAGTACGLAYDLWLKPTPWSVFGYLGGFLALVTWVWSIAGHFTQLVLLVYPAATLLILSAHLAQSLPDIEIDRLAGQRGLATLLGVGRACRTIAVAVTLVALGGLALSALARTAAPAIPILAGLGLVGLAFRDPKLRDSRPGRERMFHLTAPGIGLVGAGCLLALVMLR